LVAAAIVDQDQFILVGERREHGFQPADERGKVASAVIHRHDHR
jgi:hypothetical protein